MPTLYAPKSGYVVEVSMPNGSMAKTGDIVAKIDDENEQVLADKHRILVLLHKQAEARISAAVMTARRAAEDGRARANAAAAEFRTAAYDVANQQGPMGTTIPGVTVLPALAVQRTKNDIAKGQLESAVANDLIDRSTKMLELVKAALDDEANLIAEKIADCAIKAPVAGRVEFVCYEGAYVSAGDPIANLG